MKNKHSYTMTTIPESTQFNPRNARALLLVGLMFWNSAYAATKAPTEDSLWYYEIGGAEPVSAPANPSVVSVTLPYRPCHIGDVANLFKKLICTNVPNQFRSPL